MLILPPLLQLLMFGYVVNRDVERSQIAWMDLDRTSASRELLANFDGSRHFSVVATPANEEEVKELLDKGSVDAVVRILPGFGRDIERGQVAGVQILIDGTNSNTAAIISNYASQIISNYAGTILEKQQRQRLMARAGSVAVHINLPTLNVQSRVWFNPSLKSRNYFIPATIVQIMSMTTLMMTAMSIVREKEIGTMEQLMVTPLRPVDLILGKALPSVLIGMVQMVLITIVAMVVFQISFQGSALLLFACAALFMLTTLGTGLFISTISSTQQQAAIASFLFNMPGFMLSGFNFPIRNMAVVVQYITYLNPLRYFTEIVGAIFLKGVGMEVLWPQMLALLLFGMLVLGSSVMRFRKRLD